MICPQCAAEFEAGILYCTDCGIPLEEPLPEEEGDPNMEFEDVKTALDPGALAVLRSILQDRGIENVLKGENFLGLYPSVGLVSAPRLIVRKERAEEVRDLVRDMQESPSAQRLDDDEDPPAD